MSIPLQNIFKKDKALIGMVHLKPLLGVQDFTSIADVLDSALQDAKTLEQAGFDAIIIENNYDLPHEIFVKPEVVVSFTYVVSQLRKQINTPIGICVLWNDFYTALSIAKTTNCQFVRVPVFVDEVETTYGRVKGTPQEVLEFRKRLNAEDIAIYTDIQVKHSKLLNVRPITEAALEAIEKGSDGLIITGKWTGDAPNLEELESIRSSIGSFPILIGSGTTYENLESLNKYADCFIVGTSLKEGSVDNSLVNLKSFDKRINLNLATQMVQKFRDITRH